MTLDDFMQIDRATGIDSGEDGNAPDAKGVVMGMFKNLGFLRGLFMKKLECFTFILLALAYMVSLLFSNATTHMLIKVGQLLVFQSGGLLPSDSSTQ